jgi:glucoamylase
VVTDGSTFVQRAQDVPVRTELADPANPVYRQTATGTGWTATTTYVTDPDRASVLLDVDVRSTTGRPLQAYLLHDPSLSGEGNDDRAWSQDGGLVAGDGHAASALVADRGFDATSVGYLGVNDGWTDLSAHHGQLTDRYTTAGPGNVVQVGQLRVDGTRSAHAAVALGFGAAAGDAVRAARGSLARGFPSAAAGYAAGWRDYLDRLP